MGLCGQRLVQDKNLNPPDDRKYVIIVGVREEKAVRPYPRGGRNEARRSCLTMPSRISVQYPALADET